MVRANAWICGLALFVLARGSSISAADLILHNGRIVTADRQFSIHEAMAVRDGRILRVGSDDEVMKTRRQDTRVVDLGGAMVLPGLIDSHVHATAACMTEFGDPVPDFESIADVLAYIRTRAQTLGPGRWIVLRQVFITRLAEQRYPTLQELDEAAPKNPVMFSTGPDAALNTLALKWSGIDRNFKVSDGGPGHIERDPRSGEPTGILRGCTRFVKTEDPGRQPTDAERYERLRELLRDYNSVGLTGIIDRNAGDPAVGLYQRLHQADELPVRVAISYGVGGAGPIDKIREAIGRVALHPLRQGSTRLRIVGVKTFLDGGMLTGSAYLRQPWGKSAIYSITDPTYRGVLNIPPDRLLPMVSAAVESGLQFTAHSVGDGAVHHLLEAYAQVDKKTPIRATRPCITHSNFMSAEAVAQAARLGVVVDIQPAWLYLDTRTLVDQFGYDRLRYFQPLASLFRDGVIVGGGSDHMQKIGSLRAVNPYNPFLGMWIAVTRNARRFDKPLHPEEALTREQAIRFYTINNAYLMFLEDQVGSLEPGKLADFIILDTDLLTCPVDSIRNTRVRETYLAGRLVWRHKQPD
jgi:predicted amidohydrolase YtcJ